MPSPEALQSVLRIVGAEKFGGRNAHPCLSLSHGLRCGSFSRPCGPMTVHVERENCSGGELDSALFRVAMASQPLHANVRSSRESPVSLERSVYCPLLPQGVAVCVPRACPFLSASASTYGRTVLTMPPPGGWQVHYRERERERETFFLLLVSPAGVGALLRDQASVWPSLQPQSN